MKACREEIHSSNRSPDSLVVWGLLQRHEWGDAGNESFEEQRAVGSEALPHDGRPRSSRKTKPTTFETLTKDATQCF